MEILEYIISTTAGPQNTGAHIARGTARAMLRDLEGEARKYFSMFIPAALHAMLHNCTALASFSHHAVQAVINSVTWQLFHVQSLQVCSC